MNKDKQEAKTRNGGKKVLRDGKQEATSREGIRKMAGLCDGIEMIGMYQDGTPKCLCGNEPSLDGFTECDKMGNQVEPDKNWDPALIYCGECLRIINTTTLEVVGKKHVEIQMSGLLSMEYLGAWNWNAYLGDENQDYMPPDPSYEIRFRMDYEWMNEIHGLVAVKAKIRDIHGKRFNVFVNLGAIGTVHPDRVCSTFGDPVSQLDADDLASFIEDAIKKYNTIATKSPFQQHTIEQR